MNETCLYRKERYAYHLRRIRRDRVLSPDRLVSPDRLRDPERVGAVMTRWLARCVRDWPVVMGAARVTVHRDFLTDQFALRAEAYAFQNVKPEHREVLAGLVDDLKHSAIELMEAVDA